MSMNSIIESAANYVEDIIEKNCGIEFQYHNCQHTKQVAKTAIEIANSESTLSDTSKDSIALAALFHDVSYFKGSENHEKNSVVMARLFLTDYKLPEDQLKEIERIILATKLNHTPIDLAEKIIRDADMAHLGKEDYFETSFINLKSELMLKSEFNKDDNWVDSCIAFMEQHEYQTNYAKEQLGPIKEQNLKKLYGMKEMEDEQKLNSLDSNENDKKIKDAKKRKKKKKKSDLPEKGVETMFRVSLRNHMTLSRIADNKANTLISVNAIIISIVLSTLFPKMDNNPYLIYPGLTLLVFSITTIILSILSTIPKTSHGIMTRDDVLNKKGNLIFFGNFHKMPLEEFEWSICELMKDKEYLYKSLTRDLYFLGRVLNRKYALLRYSYYIFVIGLIVSIIAFSLSLNALN